MTDANDTAPSLPIAATPIASSAPTAQLLHALVEAQRLARGVEKTSTNTFHKYNYAGTESIILEAKDAMAQTGLALIPRGARMFSIGTRMDTSSDPRTPRDVPQLFIARRWSLVHQGGGVLELEEQVWPICPEKGRPLDKAVAAADTASLGYLLRNVLMLARVEEGTDLDSNSRDDHRDQGYDDKGERDAHRAAAALVRKPDALATPKQRAEIVTKLDELGVPRDEHGATVADIVKHRGAISGVEAGQVLSAITARVKVKKAKADAGVPVNGADHAGL